METERKVVKFESFEQIEDPNKLREQLATAFVENKKIKRLIDIFILALFLIFIMYTSI